MVGERLGLLVVRREESRIWMLRQKRGIIGSSTSLLHWHSTGDSSLHLHSLAVQVIEGSMPSSLILIHFRANIEVFL